MTGDFSRFTFNPGKHYSGVLMQQGRVQLDSDWNEQWSIERRLHETTARDEIGDSGCPAANPGFSIGLSGGDLTISAGRMYVEGILVENDAACTYSTQPSYPGAPFFATNVYQNSQYAIVYLDVWRRVITPLEDPSIREVALGGADTAVRVQTVWQVRVAPVTAAELAGVARTDVVNRLAGESTVCGSADATWNRIVKSAGRQLTARITPAPAGLSPCEILPQSGYQRLENQLYRVEVHDPGDLGTATFKWSRENGSVVTAWLKQDGLNLTVASTGRDVSLGFSAGDWVELTDDTRELNGRPGTMARIAQVQNDVLVMQSGPTYSFADFPLNPKIRRWDQQTDTPVVSVSVPAQNNGYLALEGGLEVQFQGAGFQTGDYWLIPARSAIAATQVGGIVWPTDSNGAPLPQSPAGISHRYARLAILQASAINSLQIVSDCRLIFPPLTRVPFRGIGVRDIRFPDNYPLRNGSLATVAEICSGIRIICAGPVPRGLLRSSVFCYVTMYVPYSTAAAATQTLGYAVTVTPAPPDIISYNGVLLNFNIVPDDSDARAFIWQPSAAVIQSVTSFMAQYATLSAIPMRFTMKPGVLAAPVPGQGPFEPVAGPEIDFFFSLVHTRSNYAYLQSTQLDHLQPVILSGIGSNIL